MEGMKTMESIEPAFANDNIALAFAVDCNYMPYLKYVVRSILANRKHGNLDVLVLHVDAVDEEALLSCFRGSEDMSIRFVDVNRFCTDELLQYHPRFNRFTVSVLYRLLLPELLPAYDKVLWLDVDLVVNGDLGELYNEDITGNYVGAVPDSAMGDNPPPCAITRRWARRYHFEPWQGYFNSGVLLMNLAALREAKVRGRLVEIASDEDSLYPDQDALNVVCRGRVKYLDKRWNFQTSPGVCIEGQPVIVHYAGIAKPWNSILFASAELWWKYVEPHELLGCFKNCARMSEERFGKMVEYYENRHRKITRSFSYRFGRAMTKPFRLAFGR